MEIPRPNPEGFNKAAQPIDALGEQTAYKMVPNENGEGYTFEAIPLTADLLERAANVQNALDFYGEYQQSANSQHDVPTQWVKEYPPAIITDDSQDVK